MNANKPQPGPYRTISEEEVPPACATFLMAHEGCGEDMELARLADTLVCYCHLCNELQTFLVTASTEPPI